MPIKYKTNNAISVPYIAALLTSNLDQTEWKSIKFGTKNEDVNIFPTPDGHLHSVSFIVENGSTWNMK